MGSRSWSVLVCAYTEDRWHQTTAAIESALDQTLAPHQVIVVVDHNHDLLARLASAYRPEVTVVPNTSDAGLSGARNTGVVAALGSHIAFLDDDAEAAPDWLARLDAAFDTDNVVGVGGAVVPRWETRPPGWFPDEFLWVVGCSYRGLPGPGAAIRNPIGANMAFSRSAILAAGGFDSRLGRRLGVPAGCEETDLAIRATRAGGKVIHRPDAVVTHNISFERSTWGYFRRRCLAEGRSKASLATGTGMTEATSSERRYVTRVLAWGLLSRLVRGVVRLDGAAISQAVALAGGFALTLYGFAAGLTFDRREPDAAPLATPTMKEAR